MATGGGGEGLEGGRELIQTIGNTSDVDYEYACTLCVQKKGAYSEAASYCPECDVYYCRSCLQYICDHGCIGKAKMERWGNPICRKMGQPCREHTGNLIQLYCGDDNEVCCHVCVAEKHQGCSKMVHIPTVVSKQETRTHLEEAQRKIGEMKSKLIDAKRDRAEKKKDLKVTYDRLKAEIQEFRRNMSELLEELEKQSINELNELERTINDQLNGESRASDHVQEEIESIQAKLQTSGIDDIDRFIWWKQSNKILQEAKKIVSDASPARGIELILLEFHEELETCLNSLNGLGKLKRQHQPKPHKINTPYTVENKYSFSIRNRDDSKTCCISSMCQLSDGTFVLSDHTNRCLKRFNQSNSIISRCSLSSDPFGICCTGDNEVAVGLGNKIQFVSVKDSMTTAGVVNVEHQCCGLACMNNEIYATVWGSTVYVYDTSGSLKQEYSLDERLWFIDDLLTCCSCIRISPCMNSIYITDPQSNKLLTIDMEGKLRSKLTPSDTKRLRDVCVDDVGNVFVCGVRSNTIIQVDATGSRKVGDILLQTDGINRPITLCFDRVNSRLLVACENSDTIHSLDLVQL